MTGTRKKGGKYRRILRAAKIPDTFSVDGLVKKHMEREPLKNKGEHKKNMASGGRGTLCAMKQKCATYLHFAVLEKNSQKGFCVRRLGPRVLRNMTNLLALNLLGVRDERRISEVHWVNSQRTKKKLTL